MTTSSSKIVLRVLPIASILVAILIAAITFAPDTFRYRAWPKPPRVTPLESLVGLSPRLGAGDPIAVAQSPRASLNAGAAGGTRSATPPSVFAGSASGTASRPNATSGGAGGYSRPARGGGSGTGAGRAAPSGSQPSGASRSGSSHESRPGGGGSTDSKQPPSSSGQLVKSNPTPPVAVEAHVSQDTPPPSYQENPPPDGRGEYAQRVSPEHRYHADGGNGDHSYSERPQHFDTERRDWSRHEERAGGGSEPHWSGQESVRSAPVSHVEPPASAAMPHAEAPAAAAQSAKHAGGRGE